MNSSNQTATILCAASAIAEGRAKAFNVNGKAIFAVKKLGKFYLYRNRCPHLGSELEWEDNAFLNSDGSFIQCHTHGALFEIENGLCVSGPCAGASLISVANQVRDGQLYVLNYPA